VQRRTPHYFPHCQGKSLPARAIRELGKVSDQEIADRYGVPVETVRLARALRGIPPRTGRKSTWTPERDALLGTMPDARLARRLGLTPNAVFERRRARGIAPFAPSAAERRKKWTKRRLARLGQVTDRELAEELGMTASSVVEKRMSLGIPSCTGRPGRPRRHWTKEELALLGRLHDTEVARRLGIGRRYVWAKRRELGILARTEKEIEARWTPQRLARLGKVPDRQLAAEMGITAAAVRGVRERRGIVRHRSKPAARTRGSGGRPARQPWTPERVRRLGTVPDDVIAKEMGLTTAAVSAYRTRLGILPCRPPSPPRAQS